MAVQSSLYSGTAITSRTFPSTKHIATKQHMAVWVQQVSDDVWIQTDINTYQLINNSCVLNQVISTSIYKQLEVRVADEPNELVTALSDITIVAGVSDEVVTVAGIEAEVITVAGLNTEIASLYTDKATLDSIFADKLTLYSLFTDKATLDSLYADKATLDSIFADKTTLDSIFADKVQLDAIYADLVNILAASGYASDAQLKAWIAEAEKLTADSYATEAEDTFVNIVTSDGDGTFTYTPSTDYSALHWAAKSATSSTGTALGISTDTTNFDSILSGSDTDVQKALETLDDNSTNVKLHQATTITPSADSDYTLATNENLYGRLILVDGSWTATHNIIVDNTERDFIADNSAGTYIATVKTAGGTGIAVEAGAKVWLLCDGTDVIESVDAAGIETSIPLPTKTSTSSINVDGTILTLTSAVPGTDYYFSKTAIQTVKNADTIGGFHYGLTAEAEAATGNKTEADMVKLRGINAYSIWTNWFRPVCEPEGMVYIGGRWYDIYLLNSEHITNGTSKAGAIIAGGATTYGRQYPKIPLEFGGDNSLTYGKFDWYQASLIATANKKQMISNDEFISIAYGVQEALSANLLDGGLAEIEHYPTLTSKFGIEQATGTEWIWGKNAWGGYAVVLGGYRGYGASSGSRSGYWSNALGNSNWSVGSRFACSHIELD